jgi:hypothetical protein
MNHKLVIALAVCAAVVSASSGKAQQPVESYVAFLSEADHFNSSGERLRTAAAIIRQDRANFHRFGRRDRADESDGFFADEANRQALEQMLEHGRADPGVISRIVNGTALIRVDIFRSNTGPFIRVTILD